MLCHSVRCGVLQLENRIEALEDRIEALAVQSGAAAEDTEEVREGLS